MLTELSDSITQIAARTQANLPSLSLILAVPCVCYLLTLISGNRLMLLGIIPRRAYGLYGIVFAPLLHANFNHLFFNAIPLVVLSNFILMNGLHFYLVLTISLTLMSGLLIWCFAKPGVHVGASALITGYWGFLVSNIYQQGSIEAIILGLISVYYFAGIFLGVFPGKKGVSWEGHLFGLLSGIAASYLQPLLMTWPLLS